MLLKLVFGKDMICLRFLRYLQGLNGYGTYGMSYPFVLSFQQAILFEKIPWMTKIPLSQGRYINGTLPKINLILYYREL